MRAVDYVRAEAVREALDSVAQDPSARFLAGGTSLLDLMKCGVEEPTRLVDLTHLPGMDDIEADDTALHLGALARMSDAADHPAVREGWPAVSEALRHGASQQLRNMARIGGNLMQRTRCPYFRDPSFTACNKRDPGSGCAAMDGVNRDHAVLGTSEHCIAAHPGDLAVALAAFDATVRTHGPEGPRTIGVDRFFPPPGNTPHREHPLVWGELITGVRVPASGAARHSHFVKVQDRAGFDFAAASAAVGLDLAEDGTVATARVALGGVATIPWREPAVEQALVGRPATEATFREAAALAAADAHPRQHNRHKAELARRVVARALTAVTPAGGGASR